MSGFPSANMASLAAMGRGMPGAVATPQIYGVGGNNSNVGKKAVHVKWAGKTIALGTFPHVEADEKCARAKALTRAWRSTMRPKPTREWVMLELERLQVRVVSGRIGRKGDDEEEDDDDDDDDDDDNKASKQTSNGNNGGGSAPQSANVDQPGNTKPSDQKGFSGQKDNSPSRHVAPPHRPLVGGGSAAAYEAARADHYNNIAAQQNADKKNGRGDGSGSKDTGSGGSKSGTSQKNSKSPGPGNGVSNGHMSGHGPSPAVSMPQLGLTVNPNQHYEMLKLHHMNLLNEIQETTLMMNLYQQQQLQQQQQLNDQQGIGGPSSDQQLAALQLAQQQQTSAPSPFIESLYGMGASNTMNPSQQFPSFMNQHTNQFPHIQQSTQNQFGLAGFGGPGGMGSGNNQMHAFLRQQQNMLSAGGLNGIGMQNTQQFKSKIEEKLKQDLSERQRNSNNEKRSFSPQENFSGASKKSKTSK